ncbi:ABC transporter substrate-binding protein [Mucilaginibacter mali]|uniref:ABC transporter substrate-binding protein n=1 Tax=Mucilaginibacter mali TaxID=2740462 RepID=A0A7D4QPP2_9SPHI|nr:ABC transporter substrate-binding protein [Mucilaginibacter mali]QKJ28729.1 ABC transporter substrate-binding protein [Mucilaginibacter mali]
MKLLKNIAFVFIVYLVAGCSPAKKKVPVVGFIDAFEDATIAQARAGFTDALKKGGYSEADKTVKIEYRNGQGSIPNVIQIANYFIHKPVDLLATCTTLSTLAAVQKTKTIPIFAMVSPTPERMKLIEMNTGAPANLFGAVEDLAYIDTSFLLIPQLLKPKMGKLTVGIVYNDAEPQSADALRQIRALAEKNNINILATPVVTSADAQLVTKSLLDKNIDAFFALPDNVVFASFETIVKSCDEKYVPIFTSEAGLVKRGAVVAFGADMYQWGYQAGEQAVQYLNNNSTKGLQPEMVKVRNRVFNPTVAAKYHIAIPANFKTVK